jgi:hypothetical protein
MTEAQAAAAAYTCSGGTITLLWVLALRNRAQGWFRHRHPNCYTAESEPVSHDVPALPPSPAALGSQLLALHNAIARESVSRPYTPLPQDQYADDSAAAAKSTR